MKAIKNKYFKNTSHPNSHICDVNRVVQPKIFKEFYNTTFDKLFFMETVIDLPYIALTNNPPSVSKLD